jgi:hypothetical protein
MLTRRCPLCEETFDAFSGIFIHYFVCPKTRFGGGNCIAIYDSSYLLYKMQRL